MLHKSFYSFLIFLLMSISAVAQKKAIKFQSINEAGIVEGESKADWIFQTVNGIRFSDWFAGAGIGIDYYHYKTLPLFFDGRWYFGDEKRAFIYGDIGYNFPMANKPGKEIYNYSSYHFTGGVYTDIGIGFGATLYKKSSMLFSLGYSYKELQTKIGVNNCGIIGPCWVDYSKYEFNYGRIAVKAGLEF